MLFNVMPSMPYISVKKHISGSYNQILWASPFRAKGGCIHYNSSGATVTKNDPICKWVTPTESPSFTHSVGSGGLTYTYAMEVFGIDDGLTDSVLVPAVHDHPYPAIPTVGQSYGITITSPSTGQVYIVNNVPSHMTWEWSTINLYMSSSSTLTYSDLVQSNITLPYTHTGRQSGSTLYYSCAALDSDGYVAPLVVPGTSILVS